MRRDLLQLSSAAVLPCAHVGDLPGAVPLTAIRKQLLCEDPMLHCCHVQRLATAVTSGCAALVLLIILMWLVCGESPHFLWQYLVHSRHILYNYACYSAAAAC